MTAQKFVECARALKGARWRHRGRKPWAVDCVGLIVLSAQGAGMEILGLPKYGREPWDDQLRQELRKRFSAPVADRRPGDIALIRWRAGDPSHVAIIADHPSGGLSIIHAQNIQGVIEHALSGHYLQCIEEIYRPWPDKYCP